MRLYTVHYIFNGLLGLTEKIIEIFRDDETRIQYISNVEECKIVGRIL